MGSTGFIEEIILLVKERHGIDINFDMYRSHDPKIIYAAKELKEMGRFTQHFLCDNEEWQTFTAIMPSIRFEESCLFAYYKAEYCANYLNGEVHENLLFELDRIMKYINITLLPPSVNDLSFEFLVVDDMTIRCGFVCFCGVYLELIDLMDGKPFENFSDFIIKASSVCPVKDITSLIKLGAADCFGHTRKAMLESFENFTTGKIQVIEILHNEEFSKKELGFMEFEEFNWAYSSSWFLDEDTGDLIYLGKKQ